MARLGRGRTERLLLLAALLLAWPTMVLGQARQCALPAVLPTAHPELPNEREPRRIEPIAGYTLALSWSPEYCHRRQDVARDQLQCGGTNRFGFTLHGLWPDGAGRGWPQYCRPAALVPEMVERRSLCATPSVQLLQHEWAKHGTCMANDPAHYFARSTALYGGLKFPDMDALSHGQGTVDDLRQAFARANPGMRPDMMRANLNRRGWLEELWLCLGTDFRPRSCPAGVKHDEPLQPLKIWRGGRPRNDSYAKRPFNARSSRSRDDDDRGGGEPSPD